MDVRFYLKSVADKSGDNPIEVSLSSGGARYRSTTGYKIAAAKWDKALQRVRRGAVNVSGMQYSIINAALDNIRAHFGALDDVSKKYTKDGLEAEFRQFTGRGNTKGGDTSGDRRTMAELLRKFCAEQGSVNGWSDNTYKRFKTLGNHLEAYKPGLRPGNRISRMCAMCSASAALRACVIRMCIT